MTVTNVAEAVDNGIEFLDEHYPDWREKIADGFDISSISGNCILSLVTGTNSYREACDAAHMGIHDTVELGFDGPPVSSPNYWSLLQLHKEWESRV